MHETITDRNRAHAWRVRLLAGGAAQYLDATLRPDAPLGVRRGRLAASTTRMRRFAQRMDAIIHTTPAAAWPWMSAAQQAHALVREAFLLGDGVPFTARFPLPTG